jgi:hypothetical protein
MRRKTAGNLAENDPLPAPCLTKTSRRFVVHTLPKRKCNSKSVPRMTWAGRLKENQAGGKIAVLP